MKKLLFCLIILGMAVLTACVPQTVRSGGVVLRGAAPVVTVAPQDLAEYTDEPIVYVTKSGTKYHDADCAYLSASSIPVSLVQALQEGKAPCRRCHKDNP